MSSDFVIHRYFLSGCDDFRFRWSYPAKSSSPEAEHENAPDLTAEGVHLIWSTRPGSWARAVSRRNTFRPHSALGYRPTAPEARTLIPSPRKIA